MSIQDTAHSRADQATRSWLEMDGASPKGDTRFDDFDDDIQSAVREASDRSANESEIEESRDSLETLRRGFGSIKNAVEYNNALTDSYRKNPIATREYHKQQYLARLPELPPEKRQSAVPPDYLNEQGREEWHREQSVRDAYHTAAKEKAFRDEIAEAAPLLAQVRQEYGPLAKPLQIAASLHEAMSINPSVADRISFTAGAPATPSAIAEHQAREAQHASEGASVANWLEHVQASGSLPGLERPEIQEAVCDELGRMTKNGERGPSIEQNLVNAYSRVMLGIQAEQNRADVEKARHASRSLSGAPSAIVGNVAPTPADDGDDELRNEVRRAYHRSMAA